MSQNKEVHVPLHAPNIVNICVDESVNGEMKGRIYHCYDEKPWEFINVLKLIEEMEDFYDRIAFPQASTQIRAFANAGRKHRETLKKTVTSQEVAANRGKVGTFLICVKYRQNSTWQGEVEWIEGRNTQQFISVLEFLKILSNALELSLN